MFNRFFGKMNCTRDNCIENVISPLSLHESPSKSSPSKSPPSKSSPSKSPSKSSPKLSPKLSPKAKPPPNVHSVSHQGYMQGYYSENKKNINPRIIQMEKILLYNGSKQHRDSYLNQLYK